jgi:hypothetical protein
MPAQGQTGLPVARILCQPPSPEPGPFFITQLDANLTPEWQIQNANDQLCRREPDGGTAPRPRSARSNGASTRLW